MRYLHGIILLISCVAIQGCMNAVPRKRRLYLYDMLEAQSGDVYYQGDILLDSQTKTQIQNSDPLTPIHLWPSGIIPYEFSGEYSSEEEIIIGRAMLEIQKKTCIRFLPRKTQEDYIYFTKEKTNECFSYVGRKGSMQAVNLADDCITHGIVLHELMHVIGFFHEHQRNGRGDYLTIEWDRIQVEDNNGQDYQKEEDQHYDTHFTYDSQSITHYGCDQKTLSRIGEVVIGQRSKLSELDVEGIKLMYKCLLDQSSSPSKHVDVDPYFCPKLVNHYKRCEMDLAEGCRSSCDNCRSANCQDVGSHCPVYKLQGLCSLSYFEDYLRTSCTKTCRFCAYQV